MSLFLHDNHKFHLHRRCCTGSRFWSPLLLHFFALPPFVLSICELPLFLFNPQCRLYIYIFALKIWKNSMMQENNLLATIWDRPASTMCHMHERTLLIPEESVAWGKINSLCWPHHTSPSENSPAFLITEVRKLISNSQQKYNGINLRLSKIELSGSRDYRHTAIKVEKEKR